MWEHRRLVVVHAFIRKVVVDYLNELYKFLSSTKHAFVTCKKRKEKQSPFKIVNVSEGTWQNFIALIILTLISIWGAENANNLHFWCCPTVEKKVFLS